MSKPDTAGQHLFHVASTFGEVFECQGGWLRKTKRWILPPALRFMSEVSNPLNAVQHLCKVREVIPSLSHVLFRDIENLAFTRARRFYIGQLDAGAYTASSCKGRYVR